MEYSTINTSDLVATIGLVLDVIGVVILFYFQIDKNRHIMKGGTALTWTVGSDDPKKVADADNLYRRYNFLTNFGLLCLIIGFSLQAVSIWM